MKTRVTELLGIEHPIIQGGMAWIAEARLAAAVSEAGGLGIIAAGSASADWVEDQVRLARTLTDKPIGVNIMLMSPRSPEIAQRLADLRVEVITTGAGSPSAYIDQWKEAGCKVVPVIASTALALRMQRCGADAVIAEGCEAGGHIGELTTMALVPSVCDAVTIPVIAAGGIADGRGMCAAFMLGAEAVQMGTRFLTVEECTVHDAYKERVLKAKDSDTIVTGRAGGHPVRGLKNGFSRTARKNEIARASGEDEAEMKLAGSLRRAVEGDIEDGSVMAGQIACLVNDRKTARQAIEDIMAQAAALGAADLQALADANARQATEHGEAETKQAQVSVEAGTQTVADGGGVQSHADAASVQPLA